MKARVNRYMGCFLVAILIAVTIALWTAAEGITAKEVLLSALPAWLQGIGTVAAAWFAWKAFAAWREQDAGRRRAVVAEEILRCAHRAVEAIRAVRITWNEQAEFTLEREIKFAMSSLQATRVDAMQAAITELRSHMVLIKHYRYGGDINLGIVGIVHMGSKMRWAYQAIELIDQGMTTLSRAKADEEMARNFAVIRRHVGPVTNALDEPPDDDTEKKLKNYLGKVESALADYISGAQ